MKRFVGIAALCMFAGAGCMMGEMADWEVESAAETLAGEGGAPLLMCRSIEGRLRGLEATVFRVLDHDQLVVVKTGGRLVCVDDTATLRRAGVVPIQDGNETPCTFCDGTPLPASAIIDEGNEQHELAK
jgi:hypothetical protein